ncbi:MAG: serine/threonine-protein kinase, partial [Pseudomonadota bacterium]
MDAELNHQRSVLGLVEEALSQPADAREAWLAARCNGDELAQARRLLAVAQDCDTAQAVPNVLAPVPLDSQHGQVFGAYRLIDIIGQGGMGVVYRAHRADGAYDDQVAVKLIALANPTADQVGRFQRERQLLSDLRHPNVATLLDGGTSEHGIPYVVMQYVDGVAIDRYCQEQALDLDDRLALFETVCRAVQAAHQRFVIHRDLKPENVLVEANGFARLIDFGIATTLDRDSHAADRTQVLSLTPAYASPEQVRNEPLTAATDVYSLGIMLFELLAGARPYDLSSMSVLEAERLLSAHQAQRPSVAGARERFALGGLRWKELDAIVLRAIEPDSQRRYQTAGALADDLGRFLRREAVGATLDTGFYRARRFLSRHVGISAATAIAVLALVGGLVVSLAQADRANRELARAEAVRQYLEDILLAPEPYVSDSLQQGESATIADLLEAAETRLDSDLEHLPAVRIDLYQTIANAQMWMNLPESALRSARKALTLARDLPNDSESMVEALELLAEVHDDAGNAERAIALYEEAKGMVDALGSEAWENRLHLYNNFAVALAAAGDYERALTLQRDTLPLIEDQAKGTQWGIQVYANLGRYLFETGALDAARVAYEQALENAADTEDFEYSARLLDWRVGVYHEFAQDWPQARAYYESALRLADTPYVDAEEDVAKITLLLARLDAMAGEPAAARETLDAIA